MKAEKNIRVAIADGAAETRDSLREVISAQSGMDVVAEFAQGRAVIEAARSLSVDVVVLDVGLGDDGFQIAAEITRTTTSQVIVICGEPGKDQFRRAMQAGARDFLAKPINPDELVNAILNVTRLKVMSSLYAREAKEPSETQKKGKVITVFGTKGGVGKSTIATNLAVALGMLSGRPTCLADFDLEFGCQPAMFGLKTKSSIVELCHKPGKTIGLLDVEQILMPAAGGKVMLLPPPVTPELAALVEGEGRPDKGRNYVGEIIDLLAGAFDTVLLDTASNFRETNMTCLDRSDVILVITTPDIPALQNTGKCLDALLDKLGYTEDVVKLVLNRCDGTAGLTQRDISVGLNYKITFRVPSDGPVAVWAANFGQPFVLKRGRLPLAKSIMEMAQALKDECNERRVETDV